MSLWMSCLDWARTAPHCTTPLSRLATMFVAYHVGNFGYFTVDDEFFSEGAEFCCCEREDLELELFALARLGLVDLYAQAPPESIVYNRSGPGARLLIPITIQDFENAWELTNRPLSPEAQMRADFNKMRRRLAAEILEDACSACGSEKRLVLDHKTPICRGGTNDNENLQTLCYSCNASKGTKTDEEWRVWLSNRSAS